MIGKNQTLKTLKINKSHENVKQSPHEIVDIVSCSYSSSGLCQLPKGYTRNAIFYLARKKYHFYY